MLSINDLPLLVCELKNATAELVKRILRKYKYLPDDPATGEYTTSIKKVFDQAELLADFLTKNE